MAGFSVSLRRGRGAAAVALAVAVGWAAAVAAQPASPPTQRASASLLPLPRSPSKKNLSLPSSPSFLRLYVGTYTSGASRGIYRVELNAETGAVVEGPVLAAPSKDPSFLALHPNGRVLYAVNETGNFDGRKTGAVSAFAVDGRTGNLTLLNQVSSEGADPCHLAVDAGGRNVVVANYTGGSTAVLPLDADGRLRPAARVRRLSGSGPNAARQQVPHAHGIFFDLSKKFLLTVDLGSDRILVERWSEASAGFEPNDPGAVVLEPGSGPRHLAWHPTGKSLYVVNELFSTVTAFGWNAVSGPLSSFQRISSLPAGFSGENKPAEIAVSPDGRFLYVSNRGDDALMVFAVGADGRLAPAGRVPTGGRTPRHFAIDPAGRWLLAANQGSGSLVVFAIDAATGLPRRVGDAIAIPEPVCVLFAAPAAAGASSR